jgi:beta-N-acetylhexosaminidase
MQIVKEPSMSVEQSLALPPFNLSPLDIAWVRKTRDGMSITAKLRHLFVHLSFGGDLEELKKLVATNPAGIHRFAGPDLESSWTANKSIIEHSDIPPFLTADIEGGGNHKGPLTELPNQLAFAAVADDSIREQALNVLASEAASIGLNWSFTPCIDINKATLSAIVGTRSFGSNIATIRQNAVQHVKALRRHGIATAAKHWPGEGCDDRDQHLVGTINPLGTDEWHSTFGSLYSSLIDAGILSVMSAHIALPAYAAKHGIPESLERFRPASISKLLNNTLLRGDLGFNGLIFSDATPMAGLTGFAARSEQVPDVIENGCDIFLFTTDVEQDFRHMENGLRSGRLTEQRLDDAITRIFAMKAALGLHRKPLIKPWEDVKNLVQSPKHIGAVQALANASVTLVKDTKSILPLHPERHRRITWIGKGAPGFLPGMPDQEMTVLRDGLKDRGFTVTTFDPENPPTPDNTDCVLYVLPNESSLGKYRIYLDWLKEQPGLHNIMSRYWHDIPTVMMSFGHPYYLYDAPRVPCYINAYSNVASSQRAVLERLTGTAPFTGVSPIDPFAGAPDARY